MMPANNPLLRRISLTPPSLGDNTADADRLTAALKKIIGTDSIHIDLAILKGLPDLLRSADYRIDCFVFQERAFWSVPQHGALASSGCTAAWEAVAGNGGLVRP